MMIIIAVKYQDDFVTVMLSLRIYWGGGVILWSHEHDNYAVSFGFMTTMKTNGTPMSLCVMGKLSLISDGEQKSIIDGYMYKMLHSTYHDYVSS